MNLSFPSKDVYIKRFILIIATCLTMNYMCAQELIQYKQVDSTQLYLEVYYPDNFNANKTYKSIVFFFGGGWNGGSRAQFKNQAEYLAKRGLVCFLADYRTKKSAKVKPFECVKDAKSAMRFVRSHAEQFSIYPDSIIASGGSAGGHLAASTALIEAYNQDSDDLSISCIPNALVLFNPVIDNGPGGYGYERIGDEYKTFSPLHNIQKGAPPTLLMLGTKDKLIPVETVEYYKVVMNKVGSRCDIELYKDQEHGFFNKGKGDGTGYPQTIAHVDSFLMSLGYLE